MSIEDCLDILEAVPCERRDLRYRRFGECQSHHGRPAQIMKRQAGDPDTGAGLEQVMGSERVGIEWAQTHRPPGPFDRTLWFSGPSENDAVKDTVG